MNNLIKVNIIPSDSPNKLPLLPLIISTTKNLEFGAFNLYGDVYRDTYTYSASYPLLCEEFGVLLVSVNGECSVEYQTPHSVVHINQLLNNIGVLKTFNTCNNYLAATDWSNTRAWADAGSWAMVNLNIRFRQQCGIICPTRYFDVRDRLIDKLAVEFDKLGLACDIYKPEEMWNCSGIPPDLLIKCDGYTFSDLVNMNELVEVL